MPAVVAAVAGAFIAEEIGILAAGEIIGAGLAADSELLINGAVVLGKGAGAIVGAVASAGIHCALARQPQHL